MRVLEFVDVLNASRMCSEAYLRELSVPLSGPSYLGANHLENVQ